MEQSEFTHEVRDKARQVAELLRDLSPYERALVLHEAQFLYDEERAARLGAHRVLKEDAREEMVAIESAWIGQKLHDLTPQTRQHIVSLVEGLANNAKLERLIGGDFEAFD